MEPDSISAEMRLVLLCCRTAPDRQKREEIQQAAEAVSDWGQVYAVCARQRVLPVLYRNLKAIVAGAVPAPVLKKLKTAYMANAGTNMAKTACLAKAVRALSAAGIAVLPFKGPVEAEYVYGDISLRIFSDLDILVRPEDAADAREILLESGFSRGLALNRRQMEKYVQTEDNFSLTCSKQGIVLEVHWEISGCYLARPLRFDDLPKNPEPVLLQDHPVLNLSREAMLTYLCIHGAKDVWDNLEQVMAVSELIGKKEPLDWAVSESLARQWGCVRIQRLGLHLASELFCSPVPENIMEKIQKDKTLLKFSGRIKRRLTVDAAKKQNQTAAGRFSWFHIRFRDSLTEMPRYAARLALRPTEQEWRIFPVPARFAFVHWFLRPLRLIKSGFSGK